MLVLVFFKGFVEKSRRKPALCFQKNKELHSPKIKSTQTCPVEGEESYPLEVTLWVGAVGGPADGHVAVARTLLTRLRFP